MKKPHLAPAPAKITRPLPPPGTVHRSRLHGLLAQANVPSIIWVAGPPGAGKTTFVSQHIEHAGLACLWYQIDAGDADPASFFHYLGLAAKKLAPRTTRPLPHLTPEYLANLPQFTRHYFEQLYGRFKAPGVLVFDNYQDVAADAVLHSILSHALAALPVGMRVFAISRVGPPSVLARFRAARSMMLLDWDALRLTEEETRAMASVRNPHLSEQALQRLSATTQGWAAGLVLALEREQDAAAGENDFAAPEALFDYFAEEILGGMDERAQQILLQCAFLPRVTAAQAAELSGRADAGLVFADLHARGYFTLKDANAGYQLHPLFRAFLVARASRSYDAATLGEVRARAACVLEAEGDIADAADLLIDAGAWNELAAISMRHAPTLLQQGRAQTLEKWLGTLPQELVSGDPWALYWRCMCTLPRDPGEARTYVESAFALFRARGDVAGAMLAWAAIVDTFLYEWSNFVPLNRWIAVMDELLAERPAMPSPQVEGRVTCGMFSALLWCQPQRADLPAWSERAIQLLVQSDNVPLKMELGHNLLLYCTVMGEFSKARFIIDSLRHVPRARDASPLTKIQWCSMQALSYWFSDDHRACLDVIAEGERLAESTGIRLLSANLYAQGCFSGVSHADPQTAIAMLEKMGLAGLPRPIDKALYHFTAAFVHWQRRDFLSARQHGESARDLTAEAGAPLLEALNRTQLAFTLFELGEHERAHAELEAGMEAGRGMNYIEFVGSLFAAHFSLELGKRDAAVSALIVALRVGARMGYMNHHRWNAPMMSRLCALALEQGVETDYVRGLIRRRGLLPQGAGASESWPWPVRIFTLGDFAVEVDDERLDLATRDRKRPGDLLKVIVALGGRRVNTNAIADLLWPEAEGDAGYQALHTNLHRLRKLLGKDVLRTEAGCISIDERQVWVDVWALGDLMTRVESSWEKGDEPPAAASLISDMQDVMKRYKGSFLTESGEEWWAFVERDRLRERMVRLCERAGMYLEASGDWSSAATVYEWALDVLDPCQESFYMGAMRAHHQCGNAARVPRLYHRCRATFAALLEAVPSSAMENLYSSLKPAVNR